MVLLSIVPLVIFSVILLQSNTSSTVDIISAVGSVLGIILTGIVGIIAAKANSNSKEAKINAKEANNNAKEAVVKTDANIVKTDENKAAIEEAVAKVGETKLVVEEVRHTTNSKMDLMLKLKDDLALSISNEKKLKEAEEAAFNKGKLAAMEQKEKDQLLINMPPPNKEIPSIDKTAEHIATTVVEKVITENDDALKKKPD